VLASGVNLVSSSGDKLLGGPQAGIIAGKKELIQQLKRHQLVRIFGVDRTKFAGSEKNYVPIYLIKAQVRCQPFEIL
jgi:L-seryl-tRNA(Ser) seleniumtransferase